MICYNLALITKCNNKAFAVFFINYIQCFDKSWQSNHNVTLAPRGIMDPSVQQWLGNVLKDYSFLLWDGGFAACGDKSFSQTWPCRFTQEDDVVRALEDREGAVISHYIASQRDASGDVGSCAAPAQRGGLCRLRA